jgi:hypothetical protein
MTWLKITNFIFGGFLPCFSEKVMIHLFQDRHKPDDRTTGPAARPIDE